jgi:hypothetical protein
MPVSSKTSRPNARSKSTSSPTTSTVRRNRTEKGAARTAGMGGHFSEKQASVGTEDRRRGKAGLDRRSRGIQASGSQKTGVISPIRVPDSAPPTN